jgi:hypothetical protein
MKFLVFFYSLLNFSIVYAGCEEKIFEYINASNAEQAWTYLNSKCSRIMVEDEFGEEEDVRSTFFSVSERFMMNIDKCNRFAQSDNWKIHLNLKKCLNFKAISFFKKKFDDPIKKLTDPWNAKYSAALKIKKEKDKIALVKSKKVHAKRKKVEDVATKKMSITTMNQQSYLGKDYDYSKHKIENYCNALGAIENVTNQLVELHGAAKDQWTEEISKMGIQALKKYKDLYSKYGKFDPVKLCNSSWLNIEKTHQAVISLKL